MIGARGKRDDNKNNRCNWSYIIWTRLRIESWLIDKVYTIRNEKSLFLAYGITPYFSMQLIDNSHPSVNGICFDFSHFTRTVDMPAKW